MNKYSLFYSIFVGGCRATLTADNFGRQNNGRLDGSFCRPSYRRSIMLALATLGQLCWPTMLVVIVGVSVGVFWPYTGIHAACRRLCWLLLVWLYGKMQSWLWICYVDCLKTNEPQPLYPLQNRKEIAIAPNSNLEFPCIGLVGPPQTSCDGDQCAIGWRRTVDDRTVPISDTVTERVHFINEWT